MATVNTIDKKTCQDKYYTHTGQIVYDLKILNTVSEIHIHWYSPH